MVKNGPICDIWKQNGIIFPAPIHPFAPFDQNHRLGGAGAVGLHSPPLDLLVASHANPKGSFLSKVKDENAKSLR